jgi:hypothetical protein
MLSFDHQKTYEAVRQKYVWPGMYQHIYDYITSCKTCQIIKRNTHAKRTTMHSLPVQDFLVLLCLPYWIFVDYIFVRLNLT